MPGQGKRGQTLAPCSIMVPNRAAVSRSVADNIANNTEATAAVPKAAPIERENWTDAAASPIGRRRLRLAAAMRAAVDRGLIFRNHERALGKVEHSALLNPDRRLRFERRAAMAADARLVPNHMIGIGDLPQRATLVALLPAARRARATSQAARDTRLQPVARRRLGIVGEDRRLQPGAPRSGASAKQSTLAWAFSRRTSQRGGVASCSRISVARIRIPFPNPLA